MKQQGWVQNRIFSSSGVLNSVRLEGWMESLCSGPCFIANYWIIF
jgi:hypothetical protein